MTLYDISRVSNIIPSTEMNIGYYDHSKNFHYDMAIFNGLHAIGWLSSKYTKPICCIFVNNSDSNKQIVYITLDENMEKDIDDKSLLSIANIIFKYDNETIHRFKIIKDNTIIISVFSLNELNTAFLETMKYAKINITKDCVEITLL